MSKQFRLPIKHNYSLEQCILRQNTKIISVVIYVTRLNLFDLKLPYWICLAGQTLEQITEWKIWATFLFFGLSIRFQARKRRSCWNFKIASWWGKLQKFRRLQFQCFLKLFTFYLGILCEWSTKNLEQIPVCLLTANFFCSLVILYSSVNRQLYCEKGNENVSKIVFRFFVFVLFWFQKKTSNLTLSIFYS